MTLKNTLARVRPIPIFVVLLIGLLLPAFSSPEAAYAAPIPAGCPGSTLAGPPGPGVCEAIPAGCPGSTQTGSPAPGLDLEDCPYEAAASVSGAEPTYSKDDCTETDLTSENCGILGYVTLFIQILSGLAGIAITASIIYGGIQYSAAGSDPQKVSAAKDRIRNAIIALIFFIFGLGILNWLVPGGIV